MDVSTVRIATKFSWNIHVSLLDAIFFSNKVTHGFIFFLVRKDRPGGVTWKSMLTQSTFAWKNSRHPEWSRISILIIHPPRQTLCILNEGVLLCSKSIFFFFFLSPIDAHIPTTHVRHIEEASASIGLGGSLALSIQGAFPIYSRVVSNSSRDIQTRYIRIYIYREFFGTMGHKTLPSKSETFH